MAGCIEEQVLQYVCLCPHHCSVQNYFHLKQTQDPKCPQQVPADHQVGGQWCHHNPNASEWGRGCETGSKNAHLMLSTGDLVCLPGVRSGGKPASAGGGIPPRAAAAGCGTTNRLWQAVGSSAFLLTENEWWCFHFDGASLGNSPHTLA